ncbi:MAG TPA: hypothetical protein PLD91_03960 [Spirochaetota bacterium]|nr:hypothetical protein [Spirochaetota bacterium]
MAEEKSFLQTIKLEISRSFKLVPYERLAFHKVMGIMKSDIGMSILAKELDKGPDVRHSALATLITFENPGVLPILVAQLGKISTDEERIMVLEHVKKHGSSDNIKDVIAFIKKKQELNYSHFVTSVAFDTLKTIGVETEEVLAFLVSIINTERVDPQLKSLAIESLASFKSMALFEKLLKQGDDAISYSVYKAIYSLAADLADKASKMKTDDDRLYTYSPDSEDKIVLDIRVLLGKMTHEFDGFSNQTKNAFICAMMACNHREYLIYTMKALTSGDIDLISMVLYAIYHNIERLRDPDKLFRNLIAISTEIDRFNEMIVEIFVKYFKMPVNTRPFNLLKDKLYNYIVVTLETYFENYRKAFMITDVIEKGLPESFQRIRRFVLNYCTPELKKEILAFLTKDDPTLIKHIVSSLAKRISYLEGDGVGDLALLIEVLLDKDQKSRDNSASRLEDLNFEKLYLRNRIIRLCRIISLLSIDEASSVLVNIYNYLKKYPDKDILDATVLTLSTLNYSYMLGEIEVMITTGSAEDQKSALRLLSLFTEQRSLNIVLELMKNRISEDSEVVESAITILLDRDITGNITANQIFKSVIANNPSPAIRSLAVLGLGRCRIDSDIDYLNDLFYKMGQDNSKDVIVRAIAMIVAHSPSFNKRQVVRYLQEYLKDPGIKVRIYSCLLLAQMGNSDAFRSIRDMLVIKNKGIQRDILAILGDLKSIEFSFFLLSLLKEEYGISKDIIPVIAKLSIEEMKEIDGFVVNIFRKYEAPVIEGMQAPAPDSGFISIDGLKKERVTILNMVLAERNLESMTGSIPDLINLNLRIKAFIASAINDGGGTISKMSTSNIVAYFASARAAAEASIKIQRNIMAFNSLRIADRKIDMYLQLVTETVNIINDEIIEFPHMLKAFLTLPVKNKTVIDHATMELIADSFSLREIPKMILSMSGFPVSSYELLNPINFIQLSEQTIRTIREEEEKRNQMQQQIQAELKKLKQGSRPASSAAIVRGLDNLSGQLQNELDEIDRYVQKRSTDRELIKNVRKMLTNVHNLYKVEISRLIVD